MLSKLKNSLLILMALSMVLVLASCDININISEGLAGIIGSDTRGGDTTGSEVVPDESGDGTSTGTDGSTGTFAPAAPDTVTDTDASGNGTMEEAPDANTSQEVVVPGKPEDTKEPVTTPIPGGTETTAPVPGGSNPSDETGTTVPGEPEDGLPNLDLNGREIHVLTWKATEDWGDASGSNQLSQALYKRNVKLEDQFNFAFDFITSNVGDLEFVYYARNHFMSGSAVDLIDQYAAHAGVLAVEGYYVDLYEQDYLEFEQPWWSDSISEYTAIGNRLYFASGSISPLTVKNANVIFVNESLAENFALREEIVNSVMEHTWTLERLQEFCDMAYVPDMTYGMEFYDTIAFDSFFYGMGLHLVENEGVTYQLAEELGGPKVGDAFDKFNDLYNGRGFVVEYKNYVPAGEWFKTEKSLFFVAPMRMATDLMLENELEVIPLPIPKMDEDQCDYRMVTNFAVSMYSIPVFSYDHSVSALILEALAMEGYGITYDALYKELFREHYDSERVLGMMYEIIVENTVFDSARSFADTLQTLVLAFRQNIMKNEPWMPYYQMNQNMWSQRIYEIHISLNQLKS